jgi:hypothetical protein
MRFFTNRRSVSTKENTMIFATSTNRFARPQIPFHIPNKVTVVLSQTYEEKVSSIQDGKKIKWGEPFWFLFHVLAEKIKESEFPSLRAGLLNLIYTICSNLPCPECTSHAVQYLNGINFNTIQTKNDLKMMLFNFHNTVNARKNYPIFPLEKMDKYTKGLVVPVIENFMRHFLINHKNFHLIADDMQRRQISAGVRGWFRDNIGSFQ